MTWFLLSGCIDPASAVILQSGHIVSPLSFGCTIHLLLYGTLSNYLLVFWMEPLSWSLSWPLCLQTLRPVCPLRPSLSVLSFHHPSSLLYH